MTETLHGVVVNDPYRWLEEDGDATKRWVTAQNKVTFDYLGAISERGRLKEHLGRVWHFERRTPPVPRGGRLFYLHNPGTADQMRLVVAEAGGAPRVLIDPATLSRDGTTALGDFAPTDDGKRLAYTLSEGGSDWVRIQVLDVETGKDLSDRLDWVKFSGIGWARDGSGFWYSRYDAPPPGQELTASNKFHKVYFHRLGEPQSQDTLVYENKNEPEWGFGAEQTQDGRFLVLFVSKGADRKNGVMIAELSQSPLRFVPLVGMDFSANFDVIGNEGREFIIKTGSGAPNGRVVGVSLDDPAPIAWRVIVPEGQSALEAASIVGDRIIAQYLVEATSVVKLFDLDGKAVGDVPLPGLGTAAGFGGLRTDRDTYFIFTSFLVPGRVVRFSLATGESETIAEASVAGLDEGRFTVEHVTYPSRDGTRIPMFLVHQKGLPLDGDNPTYLFGYGGFNISITPWFSPALLTWLDLGGVLAIPNLRGGGELGDAWHEGGMLAKKQNVFDDFITAAEFLIDRGYTRPARLAIAGGSNGGLLVGAALCQRPDLFGAALPAVGVMDMLRFDRFTIGWAWMTEYGNPSKAEDFKVLYAYSPYHNLEDGTAYPATLVTTADHDDRVVPAHSFKFAARLQAAHGGRAPVLIRIDTKAGHGAGKSLSKSLDEWADKLAFLVRNLDIELPEQF